MAISMLPSSMLLLLLAAFRCSIADVASDHAECMNQLAGLATCLPYVQGGAKAPTPDCCTGLKEVLSKSPKCLCVLIKDRDDPQLGIDQCVPRRRPIHAKSQLRSPSAPAKILKLPPGSPEAQIFTQPQKAVQGNAASSTAKGNSQKQ